MEGIIKEARLLLKIIVGLGKIKCLAKCIFQCKTKTYAFVNLLSVLHIYYA